MLQFFAKRLEFTAYPCLKSVLHFSITRNMDLFVFLLNASSVNKCKISGKKYTNNLLEK